MNKGTNYIGPKDGIQLVGALLSSVVNQPSIIRKLSDNVNEQFEAMNDDWRVNDNFEALAHLILSFAMNASKGDGVTFDEFEEIMSKTLVLPQDGNGGVTTEARSRAMPLVSLN
jgi:hypothetical protein